MKNNNLHHIHTLHNVPSVPVIKCINYLRVLADPDENDFATSALIEQQAQESISSEDDITIEFVSQIINLFQQVYGLDYAIFIKGIFFQNLLALGSTQLDQDCIFELFQSLKAALIASVDRSNSSSFTGIWPEPF